MVLILVGALGGGAAVANAYLSSTYGPERAVTDYLAAQAHGNIGGMMSGATYLQGEGANPTFFGLDAVTAMMAAPENRAISSVRVTSTTDVDSSTKSVVVSMTWNNNQRTQTYTVRKDPSRVHYVFYNSWRLDIPFTTINVVLPNQAGPVSIDGIAVSPAGQTSVKVIQGYHTVTMGSTDFYDATSVSANGVDGDASVTIRSQPSATAVAAAADSIKAAFGNVTCDSSKYFDCPNHTYKVPAGYYDTLPAVGGDIRANSSWISTFTGDPTSGMQLVVTADAGKVTATGTCAMDLKVDGSKVYHFKGTWTGTLTWANGSFGSDVLESCDTSRA